MDERADVGRVLEASSGFVVTAQVLQPRLIPLGELPLRSSICRRRISSSVIQLLTALRLV